MKTKTYYKTLFGIRFELTAPTRDFGLTFSRDSESGVLHFGLGFAGLYISSDRWHSRDWNERQYGWNWYMGSIALYWGGHRHMKFVRPFGDWHYRSDLATSEERGQHPYTYQWQYRPATVQNVTATVKETSSTWQWKWRGLMLPIYKHYHGIWCDFSEELGDEKDGWKGGVLGAGSEILGEHDWRSTYRWMQTQKNFCRGK